MTARLPDKNWVAIAALLFAIGGGIAEAAWIVSTRPDRDEVRSIVERESPYLSDRERIRWALEQTDALRNTLQDMREDLATMRQQIFNLSAKIDQALERR